MVLFRHVVVFKFKPSATAEQIQATSTALSELSSKVPGSLYFVVRPIAQALYPGYESITHGYTLMLDSIFKDKATLVDYYPHPAHKQVVEQFVMPIAEDFIVVDYPLHASFDAETFKHEQDKRAVRRFMLIKPMEEQEMSDLIAELVWLKNVIPSIQSVHSGRQNTAAMGSGYHDNSQGIHHMVDMSFKDVSALQQYVDHPARREFSARGRPRCARLFIVDYALEA